MAITTLSKQAQEGGTYVVQFKFKDEDWSFVDPTSLSWWLSDENGSPVNNRENVVVNLPAYDEYIVLKGNDLTPGYKILTIKGTYNSNYGSDLPLHDSFKFYVRDLVGEDL